MWEVKTNFLDLHLYYICFLKCMQIGHQRSNTNRLFLGLRHTRDVFVCLRVRTLKIHWSTGWVRRWKTQLYLISYSLVLIFKRQSCIFLLAEV